MISLKEKALQKWGAFFIVYYFWVSNKTNASTVSQPTLKIQEIKIPS